MKYVHKFDPIRDTLPNFWDKDFFKIALQRLDTSKMSPMEVAAYENQLMRVKTVANKTQQMLEEERNKEGVKAKTDAIKKGLLIGILTPEQIADMQDVTIAFVKQVEKSLTAPEKPIKKTRAKKSQNL
jgi:hypothetical protein